MCVTHGHAGTCSHALSIAHCACQFKLYRFKTKMFYFRCPTTFSDRGKLELSFKT